MSVNFNQTSDLMLLELLNEAQPVQDPPRSPLTFQKIRFGVPYESIQGERNTACPVTPAPDSNVIGSPITIRYPRVDMALFFAGGINISLPEAEPVPSTTAGLLPFVNQAFGLQMTVNDIVVANITEIGEITFTANPNSYVWFGETVVNLSEAPVNIADLILVTDLGSFEVED